MKHYLPMLLCSIFFVSFASCTQPEPTETPTDTTAAETPATEEMTADTPEEESTTPRTAEEPAETTPRSDL